MEDSQIASFVSDGVVLALGEPDLLGAYIGEEIKDAVAADRAAMRVDAIQK